MTATSEKPGRLPQPVGPFAAHEIDHAVVQVDFDLSDAQHNEIAQAGVFVGIAAGRLSLTGG
jgi:hypothetical protein